MKTKIIWGYVYTATFAALILSMIAGVFPTYSPQGPDDVAPVHIKVMVSSLLVIFFGFFGLMLADFFSNKDVKKPELVGFSLLFFNWFAILVYFWTVVHKRKFNKASH